MRLKVPQQLPPIFPTYGIHNPPKYSPCASPDCLYQRGPGEPSDPLLPPYWIAKWRMYRIFRKYSEYPPPYDAAPPPELKEGEDYQASYGITYYDSTWVGPNGEVGAMMEHYIDWSLPIFPFKNNFSCSFISLGDKAYFLTYDEDRPDMMVPVCLFSPLNHAPHRDFIKHLPYSKGDSGRLDGRVQAYSFWASPNPNEPPIQTGASPDRTEENGVLFGYAYHSMWEPDTMDPKAVPYRHPHSFYFSGQPGTPPDAPIVSQNFYEFSMTKPDPAETWDLVEKFAGDRPIPACNLFGS
jgi:hypothetical protein